MKQQLLTLLIALMASSGLMSAANGIGKFSVSATQQVTFSPGNLQYNAAQGTHQCADGKTLQGTWRFAENQWDIVGEGNNNISSTYDGWIDLFGWGTSGWESGAVAYLPWSTSPTNSDYYPGGNFSNNLTDNYAKADWGVYNQIGDVAPGTWRTLTCDEWVYLFHDRSNAENLFGLGTVNGVPGAIILPDGWQAPSGVTFIASAENGLSWQGSCYYQSGSNHYNDNAFVSGPSGTWDAMATSGAVFLPASGTRFTTAYSNNTSFGLYWSSSTTFYGTHAYYLNFNTSQVYLQHNYDERSWGFAVRLVSDLTTSSDPEPCILASGTCGAEGDNLTWELSCEGALTISGTGEMDDYCDVIPVIDADIPHRRKAAQLYLSCASFDADDGAPWYGYTEKIKELHIADGVTHIGEYAFGNCIALASDITIPNSVTSIGTLAFSDCTALENITFAGAVPPTTIIDEAFYQCTCTFTVPCGSKEAYVQALGVDAARVIEPQPAFTYSVATSDETQGTVTVLQEPACDDLTLAIRADANDGYVFKQWSDGNNDNPRSLTLSGDLALTAQFEPITTQLPVVDVAVISQDCSQNGITAIIGKPNIINGHEYVDLGLPSGLLWATCNVGANLPEQAGDYYAWGEIQTKSNYTIPNYIYENNQISLRDISGTEYDAARAKWGNEWKMPSRQECKELMSNCTQKDTTINEINGKLLTGSNGNWIFIPCSGHYNEQLNETHGSGFWTSTACGSCCAYRMWEWGGYISMSEREQGFPIRPVCSKESSTQSTSTDYTLTLYAAGCETPNTFTCSNGQAVMVKAIPQVHYHFVQWSDGDKNAIRTISVTSDSTLTAEFAINQDIVLQDNENADYYTQFAKDYNGVTVTTATLNRRFAYGQWATLCLPFDVSKGMMTALGLNGRVYEFRYAETEGPAIVAYFAAAQSIEAGKGYIVNANSKLSQKTSFVFPNVTVNTDADNGDITALTGYNDNSGRGGLYLVGTLRTGRLTGSADGSTYLGLKDNKLYYPNSATGTAVRAYRGFFCSGAVTVEIGDGDEGEPLVPQRVRIMVDGVESGELKIDNGEYTIDNGELRIDNSSAVKYISDGILYIERNGRTYNAQGQIIIEN